MEVRGVDWYWIFWTLTLFAGACGVLIVFFIPETYVPFILATEAKRLRKETGDDRWHAALEKKNNDGITGTLKRTVLKPFIMIVEEPMLAVITLYMSLVYGVVYLLFEAIPIVFEGRHGLNPLESGLVFLALLTGGSLGVLGYVTYFNRQYMKIHHAIKPHMVPPEERLKPLMYAAPALAISFFWCVSSSPPLLPAARAHSPSRSRIVQVRLDRSLPAHLDLEPDPRRRPPRRLRPLRLPYVRSLTLSSPLLRVVADLAPSHSHRLQLHRALVVLFSQSMRS